ncbi:OmpA family protein [Pedobacter sp. MC2016-24]|uniref:OmpA family protein n=1 Tax=Pedobacter sp. MC2016-24 TaxID=2780090 RepID=UPI00187E18CA|nr:OmpA family protein [Pedobacter sp. MC2016-24]MBE9600870.1 OmpA family protein [Pedobacter sp. MC2016-24]
MKILKNQMALSLLALSLVSMQACKTKKIVAKPNPPVQAEKPVEAKVIPPAPEEKPEPAPVPEKPDFNFSNVQFEFNSDVLKTSSFETLDRVAREIKKDPSAKFVLDGYSSIEGSAEHNMSLSVDRANSVKSYLVNAGVNAANLTIKGYGAANPIASNSDEAGRAKNRRVEFKAVK